MAGRHGVPAPERRTHARSAAGARRRRAQDRDAAQPWAAWLAVRGLLALLVLAAATWSVLLLTQSRGGIWPVIALAAGALSLLMIGLDVRARARQRARWHAAGGGDGALDQIVYPEHPSTLDEAAAPAETEAPSEPAVVPAAPAPAEAVEEVRPPGRRRSHRK